MFYSIMFPMLLVTSMSFLFQKCSTYIPSGLYSMAFHLFSSPVCEFVLALTSR